MNKVTAEEARELMIDEGKDPDQGMEYLNGLEDENGLYRVKDVETYCNR